MDNKQSKKFTTAVSTIRNAITRRVNSKTSKGFVSSADVSDVSTPITGPARGAVVREAFASLVREEVLKMTKDTVYNSASRHTVAVYKAI